MAKETYSRWITPWVPHRASARLVLVINVGIGVFFGCAFIAGAWRDGTTVMPGRSVGLFEHPAIWIFLGAQIIVPFVVSRSIGNFASLHKRPAVPLAESFISKDFYAIRNRFQKMLATRDVRSRHSYEVLLVVGLGFWAWNTFQNLRAGGYPRFDFWDSSQHFWGYWLTRVYKLYIWLVVAPGALHAQFSIARALRRLLRTAEASGSLVLDPYDPDGAGGTRSFIDTALLPMFSLILPAVLLTTAATWVHGEFDATTIGAIAATLTLFLLIYVYPAVSLRRAIIAEKDRQKRRISGLQRSLYDGLLNEKPIATTLKDPTSVLLSLSAVTKQIDSLPNWPQLARVAQAVVIMVGSPLVAPLIKAGIGQAQKWLS